MICVKKITDEKVLKCDIDERAFAGGGTTVITGRCSKN